jgi:two-component system LytT family response regulator
MKLNCLVVDDEPIARDGLAQDLKEFSELGVIAVAENAFHALQVLNSSGRIDILFLDIDMPGLNGLDLLKLARIKPVVIITTAYPQYALDGFELGVVDYLLKPVSSVRLKTAIDKATKWLALPLDQQAEQKTDDFLYIKCNGKYEKILFSDIRYVEAANNYVYIYTAEKKFISYLSLKSIQKQLPSGLFVRVHKSYLVSRRHIDQIKGSEIWIQNTQIKVSRNFKNSFIQKVLQDKVIRKQ